MEVETTSLGRQREQPPDDWGRIIRNDDDGQGKREDVGRADDSSDSGESDPEAQAVSVSIGKRNLADTWSQYMPLIVR